MLSAFRRAGVPLQRIRPAVARLARDMGIEHALASNQLDTDGTEVLLDYGNREGDEDMLELVGVCTGQVQLSELVKDYLRRIT